ncbi:MAG: SpoIIE family protein phosphatase [Flexilinea sp.]
MNDLCTDIGYISLAKFGEQLCGDHVDIVRRDDDSTVVVLADGLGSGVKASILSTLTSKIISTMITNGMSIEECNATIAATLPVCADRGLAYSTFTVFNSLLRSEEVEIIQYDNPFVILLREGQFFEFPKTKTEIAEKTIYNSRIPVQEGDIFILMSDGAIHAGVGRTLNFGWKREDIIEYMKPLSVVGYTAKTLTKILIDECSHLYEGKPRDDTTVCTVKIRKREPMSLLIGPPSNRDDDSKMMSLFFSKEGKHIICGGTTAKLAAAYLEKPLVSTFRYIDPDIPPVGEIEGVDLVTEGVVTINRVLVYAQSYLKENDSFADWSFRKDAASLIACMLFEEATDINFFVGKAVNPAHQNPDLPITFNIKMRLIDELAKCLEQMGKRIKVSYF